MTVDAALLSSLAAIYVLGVCLGYILGMLLSVSS